MSMSVKEYCGAKAVELRNKIEELRKDAEDDARRLSEMISNTKSEPTQLTIIKPGSIVTLTNGIKGVVVIAHIGNANAISYQCAWWNNGMRSVDCFLESEVQLQSGSKNQIGFAQ